MLEWLRHRDEITCEVYYTLYDESKFSDVVTIRQVNKKYRVQILNHVPFHCNTLKIAKSNGKFIYENAKMEK